MIVGLVERVSCWVDTIYLLLPSIEEGEITT